jgi:hypothetical protein
LVGDEKGRLSVARIRSLLAIMIVMTIVLVGCGGSDDAGGESSTTASAGAETANPRPADDTTDLPSEEEATEQAQDLADDLVESLEEQQEAMGGGGATITVGDTTWTFDSVLCAFGPEEIGQEGAEFVLSSLQDGLQLYVSIDSFGHSVSVDDVSDFQNPSVSLMADKFTASATGAPEEFVEVDGKAISATPLFVDGTTDDLTPIEGELEATCP